MRRFRITSSAGSSTGLVRMFGAFLDCAHGHVYSPESCKYYDRRSRLKLLKPGQ